MTFTIGINSRKKQAVYLGLCISQFFLKSKNNFVSLEEMHIKHMPVSNRYSNSELAIDYINCKTHWESSRTLFSENLTLP